MNFVDVTARGHREATPSSSGPTTSRSRLPPRLRASVACGTSGRKITAGFRPEHLELNEASGRDSAKFPGRADVVEYLGNEELLHVTAADQDIVAIVDSSHRVKPGDDLTLALPLSKLHLFDAETGLSLASERAAAAVA